VLGITWRWILIQDIDEASAGLVVCMQRPAPGAVVTEATLAIGQSCDVPLPSLEGMTKGEATALLDKNNSGWQLLDGVDIDFQSSLDSAPASWHVCDGDARFALEDALDLPLRKETRPRGSSTATGSRSSSSSSWRRTPPRATRRTTARSPRPLHRQQGR